MLELTRSASFRTTSDLRRCWRDKIGVGIGIGIEKNAMGFGHEKLEVYRAALAYAGWAYPYTKRG